MNQNEQPSPSQCISQVALLENRLHFLETGGVGVALSEGWNAPHSPLLLAPVPRPGSSGSKMGAASMESLSASGMVSVAASEGASEATRSRLEGSTAGEPQSAAAATKTSAASSSVDDTGVDEAMLGESETEGLLLRAGRHIDPDSTPHSQGNPSSGRQKKLAPKSMSLVLGSDGQAVVEVIILKS